MESFFFKLVFAAIMGSMFYKHIFVDFINIYLWIVIVHFQYPLCLLPFYKFLSLKFEYDL